MTYVDSYYLASANLLEEQNALEGEVKADVCVIGAGFTGLSTALHLAEKGYSVAVLEAERIGWGASGRNGGHVGMGQRRDQEFLEKHVGKQHARSLWEFGLEALRTVRQLIERHHIDCDLKLGDIYCAAKPAHFEDAVAEREHLAKHYHYEAIDVLDRASLKERVGSERFCGGLYLKENCHLHPLNYLLGLARAAQQRGVRIFENSRALSWSGSDEVLVKTAAGQLRCQHLAIATNGYLAGFEPRMARKIMPINSYILATEPLTEAQCRSVLRDDTSAADSLFKLNYWKLSGDNRLIYGGGETYSGRMPADIKAFVRPYMLRTYPQLEQTRIDYAWGGTLAITMNRLPHFGHLQPNVIFAHGFSGHGIPTGSFAGELLAEAIDGSATRFDVMANIPIPEFPGGTLLRWPLLQLAMFWFGLMDRL